MKSTQISTKESRRSLRLVDPEAAVSASASGRFDELPAADVAAGSSFVLRTSSVPDAWFETLFRHAPIGIAMVDERSRFQAANPTLCTMLDCDERDLLHKTIEDITVPEDRRPHAENGDVAEVIGRPTSTVIERRLIKQSTDPVWVCITPIDVTKPSDHRVRGLVIFEDITIRREADRRLRAAEIALRAERSMLESKNTALREVLEQIDTHKRQSARQLQSNVNRVIRPMLQILTDKLPQSDHHLVVLLDSTLRDLLDPFVGKLENLATSLTRRETEVCNMIRNGFSSKQIASVLHTSVCTVHNQRRSIRKKLRIDDGVTNLESYLKSF